MTIEWIHLTTVTYAFECPLLYYSVLRLSTARSRSVYQQDFSDYFAFDRFFYVH